MVLGQHTVTSPGHLATGCEVGVAWGAVVEGLVGADGVVDLAEASVTVHTVATYPRVCPRAAEPPSRLRFAGTPECAALCLVVLTGSSRPCRCQWVPRESVHSITATRDSVK